MLPILLRSVPVLFLLFMLSLLLHWLGAVIPCLADAPVEQPPGHMMLTWSKHTRSRSLRVTAAENACPTWVLHVHVQVSCWRCVHKKTTITMPGRQIVIWWAFLLVSSWTPLDMTRQGLAAAFEFSCILATSWYHEEACAQTISKTQVWITPCQPTWSLMPWTIQFWQWRWKVEDVQQTKGKKEKGCHKSARTFFAAQVQWACQNSQIRGKTPARQKKKLTADCSAGCFSLSTSIDIQIRASVQWRSGDILHPF